MTPPEPSPSAPRTETTAIASGWRARVDPRRGLVRVLTSANAIVQIVVAATGAYLFASAVLQHPSPLLAATVTVSSLGLVRDARPRRVLETVIGMLVGILVSELMLVVAGSGWWQLALSLAITLVVARFVSPQPGFAISAGLQSVIVMVLPATVPLTRLTDGVIGGVAALLVTALLPRNPRQAATRDGTALFAAFDGACATIVQSLRRADRVRAARGLEKSRGLQPGVDQWRSSLESGMAIVRISPFLRRQRSELEREERIRRAMDLAIRNLRVVARRTVYLVDDGASREVAADLLSELARGARIIAESLDDISLAPVAREALLPVARRLDPGAISPEASLGDKNLLAALRPLAVDLLTATGMPDAEARASIPRI